MALYWKNRSKLFGERWLLPLVQTGAGALTMDDIEGLRRGGVMVVPRKPPQAPLLISDPTRMRGPPGHNSVSVTYYLSRLYARDIAMAGGFDLMIIVTSEKRFPVPVNRHLWEMVLAGLPLRIKRIMVAQKYEEGRERWLDSLGFQVSRTMQYNTSGTPSEQIADDSQEGVLRLLQNKGISLEHIPIKLGGLYDTSVKVKEFIRERLSIEDIMSGTCLRANVMATTTFKAIAQVKRVPNETDKQFLRRRNAVYARRVHQRKANEVFMLQHQCEALKLQNDQLVADNDRLERLLVEALTWVSLLGNEASPGQPFGSGTTLRGQRLLCDGSSS